MQKAILYISKMRRTIITDIKQLSIKIEGLWREANVFDWELKPDVNILSGANGSGKSTILRILYFILTGNENKLRKLYDYEDGGGEYCFYEFYRIELLLNKSRYNASTFWFQDPNPEAISHLTIDFFASLDQQAVSREDIQAVSKNNTNIRSQIDFDLYHHQIQYTKYLLSIAKRAEKTYANGDNIAAKLKEIYAQKTLFFDMIDGLFAETDKKIDRESDELQFIKGKNTPLSVYDLSSGEKQMLLILLKSLLQDNKPSIYLLDEPEISLHPDWQENLIDNIRLLNPTVLLIIATHSPDMIVNGWLDKVLDMRELLIPLIPEIQHES